MSRLQIDSLKNIFRNSIRIGLLGLLTVLLSACGSEFVLLDPKGWVGVEIRWLIIFSFLIMLIVVIPVFIMAVWFPYKYRQTNTASDYKPNWEHSNKIEFFVWLVPIIIILILGVLTYQTSHSLDPRKPLVSEHQTLRIHVVALDWKWLFIYPDEGIATVNEIAMPLDVPVEFIITSDSVMNSFFIPQLGGMIYAMAGMENRMHLVGNEVGTYRGISANYSGFGYSGMKFDAHVLPKSEYQNWLDKVKQAPDVLSDARYAALKEKSKDHPIEYFSQADPLMFNNIVEFYTGEQDGIR